MKRFLILNRIRTPDGTVLTSYYTHDYKTYVDKNGYEYMVDGGLSYLRRNECPEPHEELSVYSDAEFEIVRQAFHWGTYGKDGTQPLTHIKLSEMSDSHIDVILKTQKNISQSIRELFVKELTYRDFNKIKIEDIK